MRHKLFNILAAVSLMLLIGAASANLRSCDVQDVFVYRRSSAPGAATAHNTMLCIVLRPGAIQVSRERWEGTTPRQMQWLSASPVTPGFSYFSFDTAMRRFIQPRRQDVPGIIAGRKTFGVAHWGVSNGSLSDSFAVATVDALTLPIWLVAVFFTIVPLLWLRRRRIERRRNRPGFCQNCGYDLRATPKRCPECGTEVPAPAPPAAAPGLPS